MFKLIAWLTKSMLVAALTFVLITTGYTLAVRSPTTAPTANRARKALKGAFQQIVTLVAPMEGVPRSGAANPRTPMPWGKPAPLSPQATPAPNLVTTAEVTYAEIVNSTKQLHENH